MGPSVLFDKSFLQMLSVDEAACFDALFRPVIAPMFFVETLADLAKTGFKADRTAEGEVRKIADKTPQMSALVCAHHSGLITNSLMDEVSLAPIVPVPGGIRTREGDKRGVVFKPAPEQAAFDRWKKEQFSDVERHHAKLWRENVAAIDLEKLAERLRRMRVSPATCKSVEQARELARAVVENKDQPVEKIAALFQIGSLDLAHREPVLGRYHSSGFQALRTYAPFAAHVLEIEAFFHICLAAHLIASTRPSHRIDMTYLYYMPFCEIFVSNDRLHRTAAPLFLQPYQEFIWGDDLKQALKAVSAQVLALPEAERDRGLMNVLAQPMDNGPKFLLDLWDRRRPGWRDRVAARERAAPEGGEDRLGDFVRRAAHAAPDPDPSYVPIDQYDSVTVERMVTAIRGQHLMLPREAIEKGSHSE